MDVRLRSIGEVNGELELGICIYLVVEDPYDGVYASTRFRSARSLRRIQGKVLSKTRMTYQLPGLYARNQITLVVLTLRCFEP